MYRSKWSRGLRPVAVSAEANGVVSERFEFTIDADMSVGDIIEIGGLPAYHRVVDAVLVTDALGVSTTLACGLMSGTYGEDDDARTCGSELFAATATNAAAVTRMSKATGFRLASTGEDRGIGLELAGAGITASGQKVTLVLSYAQ